MNDKTIAVILNELERQGDVPKDWLEIISKETMQLRLGGSWHSQILIGFGAWLSSLLFIGFLIALGMTVGGFGIYGVMLLVASVLVSKFKQGTFWDQVVLAFSLAGQAFVIIFIIQKMDSYSISLFKFVSPVVVVFNLVWPFILIRRTQAFISMIFVAAGVIQVCYGFDVRFLVPLVPPALFFIAAFVVANESKFFSNPISKILPSIATGLLFGGLGAVSLSTYDTFESFAVKFGEIYPYRWLTSILVILSVFFFCNRSGDVLFKTRRAFAYAAVVLIGIASLKAPGILFAFSVAIIGAVYLEDSWLWLGLFFGAVFTVLFVYGSDLSLLTKSYVLVGLGITLLAIRKVLPSKKASL